MPEKNPPLEKSGRVIALTADDVLVELDPAAPCAGCASAMSCSPKGAGGWGRAGHRPVRMGTRASFRGHTFTEGETVVAMLPASNLVSASVLVYLAPLCALLAGALLGECFALSEPVIIALALVGLVSGQACVRWWTQRPAIVRRYRPLVRPGSMIPTQARGPAHSDRNGPGPELAIRGTIQK